MESTVTKWIGFVASLICYMFAGSVLSFNVYAVPLKIVLDLSQTEVELMGSLTVAGISMTSIGSICYYKYGCRPVYILGMCIVNTTCILMWVAMKYADFFKDWVAFLCILLFLNSSGMAISRTCCMAIGVLLFPKRRALVIAAYTSSGVMGKMYYTGLYQIFFKNDNDVGGFFVVVGCGFSVVTVLCFLFHRTPVAVCSETIPLKETPDTSDNDTTDEDARLQSETWQKKDILKSYFYHLLQWPNVLVGACVITFLNNLTILSTSVNIEPRELPLYIFSVGVIVSRLVLSVVYDYYGTIRAGFLILFASYLVCSTAMLIGIIHLSANTVYVMTILISLTGGQVFSLALVIMTMVYGSNNLFLFVTLFEVSVSVSLVITQIIFGIIYDYTLGKCSATTSIACRECFFWNFVLFFLISFLCSIVIIVCILFVGRRNSINR